ncbi:MAG: hypothetical protein LBR37_01385 [Erysipelotrichaceae bacterium]|jgi:single-stranded DNA-binding protein|nr:hypothetical protein [Erysipelotrichaceae bacterium]
MLSNVVVVGKIKGNMVRHYRMLEIETIDIYNNTRIKEEIYISYWNQRSNNILERMKEGSLVIIQGRIHKDKELGITIAAETFEYFGAVELKNV